MKGLSELKSTDEELSL